METLPLIRMPTKTILVIDDEVAVSEIVKLCLSDLGGWDVSVVSSPLQGLQRAVFDRPDAIVLDISMPGMDGFAFLEQLRKTPETQAIPVILLSAKVRWINSQILQKYQVAGAIAKPFDALRLSTQIAMLLGWDSPREA